MQPAATMNLQKNGAQVREDKLRRDKQLRRKYSLPWPGPEGTMSTMPSTSLLRQLSSIMVSDEGLVVMEIPVAADDDMGLTAPALLTHRLPGKSDVLPPNINRVERYSTRRVEKKSEAVPYAPAS